MEPRGKVDRLFLELSSETRLGILRELQAKELRLGELGRRLGLTATEAVRQLKRMSEALLIQRKPEGSYTITPYGRLVLQLSASLEFVSKHKEYFATHDLSRLPPAFVNRIGELARGTLNLDTMEVLNTGQRMIGQAERYFWSLVPGPGNELLGPTVREQSRKGVNFRFLIPESRLQATPGRSGDSSDFELRILSDLPAIVALTESEALVALHPIQGRWDFAGFHAVDSTFVGWAKDLFLDCWDRAKRPSVL